MTCLDGEAHPLYCIIPDVEIVKMAFSSDQVVSTAVFFLRYDVVLSLYIIPMTEQKSMMLYEVLFVFGCWLTIRPSSIWRFLREHWVEFY